LSWENIHLGGGPIGSHYLRCLIANYDEFLATGHPADRRRAWVAVHTACQWLCQLGGLS
jgi:hypothetical protein